jgi:hypothetical protein
MRQMPYWVTQRIHAPNCTSHLACTSTVWVFEVGGYVVKVALNEQPSFFAYRNVIFQYPISRLSTMLIKRKRPKPAFY